LIKCIRDILIFANGKYINAFCKEQSFSQPISNIFILFIPLLVRYNFILINKSSESAFILIKIFKNTLKDLKF